MNAIVGAISALIDTISDFSVWLYELALYQIGYWSLYFGNYLDKSKANLIDIYDYIISTWMNYSLQLYDFIQTTALINAYNSLYSSDVGYFLDVFKVSTLLTAFITASLIRFGIRRLPVIG